ncbi:MAG TPA: hypothetical protein VH969_03050 [Actinophytocola sp.]
MELLKALLRLRGRPVVAPRRRAGRTGDLIDEIRVRLVCHHRDDVAVLALGGRQALELVPAHRVALGQGTHARRLGAQGVPLDEELPAQQCLQGLAQIVQLRTQRQDVLSGLFFGLAARLGLDLELELAAGRHLALELELVALLPLGGLVLALGDLPPVPRREERTGERRPQTRDDAQPHQLEVVTQYEYPGRHHGEHDGSDE